MLVAVRGAVVSAALLLVGAPASARSEADVTYTQQQVFSAALRHLRVDLEYVVTEKDPDAAYLLFSFDAPGLKNKSGRGSIEVVQRKGSVRLVVNLPQLPSYHEEVLKQGLLRKLRDEYGAPPGPKPAEPDKPDKPDEPEEGAD